MKSKDKSNQDKKRITLNKSKTIISKVCTIPTIIMIVGIVLCLHGCKSLYDNRLTPTNNFDLITQNKQKSSESKSITKVSRGVSKDVKDCNTIKDTKYLIGQITIPKIQVKADIYCPPIEQQYTYLRKGVTSYDDHINGSDFTALSGHNMRHGNRMFTNLHKLKLSDKVVLTSLSNDKYSYEVINKVICQPDDLSLLDKYNNTVEGYLLLITCTNKGKQRLILVLRRV